MLRENMNGTARRNQGDIKNVQASEEAEQRGNAKTRRKRGAKDCKKARKQPSNAEGK
jgi:hypothetical protein